MRHRTDRADMIAAKIRERGATLLLVTFVSTFFLIPIIGVCIDGAVLYWVKARLSAAVDATALATGRSLNVGQSDSAQISNALAIGQMYFTANFPTGVMKTTVVGGTPTITGFGDCAALFHADVRIQEPNRCRNRASDQARRQCDAGAGSVEFNEQ